MPDFFWLIRIIILISLVGISAAKILLLYDLIREIVLKNIQPAVKLLVECLWRWRELNPRPKDSTLGNLRA